MHVVTPIQPVPGYLSWPVIVLAFFLFLPVGLILLGVRLSQDRASQMAMGTLLMVAGGLTFLFFIAVGCVGFASKDEEGRIGALIICFAFAAGGLYIAAKGAALRRKRDRVRHYLNLIVNQGLTRVDEIAIASGRADFSKVMAEIQKLIQEGFLPGYRLDVPERLVIHFASHAHTPEEIGFACQSCGAKNMILARGTYVRCEYCGTAVKV
jgi:hypothetical protein